MEEILAMDESIQYREIDRSEVTLIKLIGEGSAGKVYKGKWRNVIVAVKVLPSPCDTDIQALAKEFEVMSRLRNHPNVIPFLGACTDGGDTILVLTQFAERGSLYSYRIESKSAFSPEEFRTVCLDSASALAYFHS